MLAGPYARDMGAGNRILQARSSSTRMRRLRWAVCCARAACAVSCASLVGSPALRRRWVGAATWVSRSRSAGSLRRRTVVLARSEPADPGDGRCATARPSKRCQGEATYDRAAATRPVPCSEHTRVKRLLRGAADAHRRTRLGEQQVCLVRGPFSVTPLFQQSAHRRCKSLGAMTWPPVHCRLVDRAEQVARPRGSSLRPHRRSPSSLSALRRRPGSKTSRRRIDCSLTGERGKR